MANRYFDQFNATLERNFVSLYAVVNFGAAGAPTLEKWDPAGRSYSAATATGFRGVKSLTRTSAGTYDINLHDSYNRFLGLDVTFQDSSAAAAPLVIVQTPNANLAPTGGNSSGSSIQAGSATPKISITFLNTSGVATDPASGEQVLMQLQFSNGTGSA